MDKSFYLLSPREALNDIKSDEGGLSESEAKNRLDDYGFNEITEKEGSRPIYIFLKQFNSVLIYILIAAAVIGWFYGRIIDVYIILFVITINAIVGFVQEYRAEKAIQSLKKIIVPVAKVYRNGAMLKIDAKYLVPGDVIFLEEGDKVPADARIIDCRNFKTVESSLTGESTSITKDNLKIAKEVGVADRKNMVWMGTFVVGGHARAVVVATGNETVFGTIAKDIGEIKRRRSPFELKIDLLAKQMAMIAILGATVTFIVGYLYKGIEFEEILFFTIASLVSGIPEGLPAILIVVLAIGAHRMANRNAIVRRLPSTETLGVSSVICTDKTGTLTQNTMNVRSIALSDKIINVTGNAWESVGDFVFNDNKISPLEYASLARFLHIACLCNNAKLLKEDDKYRVIGDPTEASLVVLAQKAGLKPDILEEKKIEDESFSSELRYRASLVSKKEDTELYVVGSPEVILDRSKYYLSDNGENILTGSKKKEFLSKTDSLTSGAMRTIALGYRKIQSSEKTISDDLVSEIVFVGVVGIIDPPRPEARESVLKAKKAGIRVIMTTGDHKGTALAIAREVGIIEEKDNNILTESELLVMSDKQFSKAIKDVNVFARLTPKMKLKIAEELQNQGHIIAMTGDGVNDAPALKKADIGIAMGITGTDVAREASEIVLTDDNFRSIVNAIEEGRIVFNNTRQASSFLITTNFAEDVTLISSLALFTQLPLLPTQILWLNLVTDGFVGLALAAEPGHGDVLKDPPRKKNENILARETLPFVLIVVFVMAVLTLGFFGYHLSIDQDIDKARSAAFVTMAFTQLFNILNMRSMRKSVFKIGLFSNPYVVWALVLSVGLQFLAMYVLSPVFNLVHLNLLEITLIIIGSSFVLWIGELYKYLRYRDLY